MVSFRDHVLFKQYIDGTDDSHPEFHCLKRIVPGTLQIME